MIFKLLFLTHIFVMGVGSTVIVVFGLKAACNMMSDAILSLYKIKTAILAVNNFARFAELYYKALTYIPDPDKVIRNELKRQWEEELCQK